MFVNMLSPEILALLPHIKSLGVLITQNAYIDPGLRSCLLNLTRFRSSAGFTEILELTAYFHTMLIRPSAKYSFPSLKDLPSFEDIR